MAGTDEIRTGGAIGRPTTGEGPGTGAAGVRAASGDVSGTAAPSGRTAAGGAPGVGGAVGGPRPSARHEVPDHWWWPGLTARQSDREPRPDWAAFTEEVLSAAPLEPRTAEAADTGRPGLAGFETVLAPFAECAVERSLRSLPDGTDRDVDLPAVRADFVRHLSRRLARIAARTLVLELNVARVSGRLGGATPAERFRDFLRLTGRRDGLTALLTEYAVLARLLARTSLDAAAALAEMLDRLAADRALLAAGPLVGRVPGRLVSVDPAAGDSHHGGRTVMLLRFADGTGLVYKPRPLSAHRHFNELAEWFNTLPGTPDLRVLALLDRGTYGWVEFAEERPCPSADLVESFYRRQGALLALLHVLDGTDLHYENVIACGEHPVLVDVETLFHPAEPADGTDDPAARALQRSVYRVGLLPQLFVGDESALDVSGIGGGRAALSPVEGVDWAGAGTDEMRLVRRAHRFTESSNQPRLLGAAVDPTAYTEALLSGFRAGYEAVRAARAELTGPEGLLHAFAGDAVRVVARPTRVYATLLDESTHPDLLRNADERQKVLELLHTDALGAGLPVLVEDELTDLWAGDVPLFTTRPDSTDLWSASGRRLPGPSAEPGLARVDAKLAALGPVDRQDQEWIIRAAMVSTSATFAHHVAGAARERTAATAPEPEHLLSAARSVGDLLVSLAYHGHDRTNWIGLELLGERYWRLGPMAADLAGGYTGPALFLAQLAALTGADRYAEAARSALTAVPGLLATLHGLPDELGPLGSGAFAGLGGITYALTEVARLLDDPQIREWAGSAVRLTRTAAETETEYGVRSGVAGGLVALLAAHRNTGDAEAWQGAQRCAARITEAPLPTAAGFADGAAGLGWALLRFAEAGGGDGHRRKGLAALRAATAASDRSGSWCRGRTGIALAVADSPAALADPRLGAWARGTAAAVAKTRPPHDDSLCHGELGILELLGHEALPQTRADWVRRAGALLAGTDGAGPRCGTPGHVPHPGLLTGLAGIGHGLLRAGFAERTPPALLLTPSAGRAPAD
ncbi:type 2 lanthipeptide synthetase LanM family protein [Streptomyces sp. DT24]|uniref:type 2 lanthipeptide synthetase LanM family protein n=1 Tax=Streptomyces sp. DT24 TaxID=3416520 RepID=UPI003CEC903A